MSTSEIVAEVRQAAEKFPEKVAVIAGEQPVIYSELIRRAQSAGAHIAQQAAGENVGIFLPNSLDFPPYVLGALWAGKTVAVLPPPAIFADSSWVKFGKRAGIDLRSLPYSFIALDRDGNGEAGGMSRV